MKGVTLIAGLGNPGARYANNRHNVGFWFADMLAESNDVTFSYQKKLFGYLCKVSVSSTALILFKPDVYMNESGRSLQAVTRFYQIEPSQILVVHDEIDFPTGKIRLKEGGGHGGHNGLRSIIAAIGNDFWRLRVGVGHPGHKDQVTGYVLGNASEDDTIEIRTVLRQSKDLLPDLVNGEFEMAMNTLHG